MEDEEILTQEDALDEEMSAIEKEEADEKEKTTSAKKPAEETTIEETSETYERFMQPARLGIVNTITGDIIEGFESGRDEGIVQLGKAILNRLDKIGIASGV